MTGKISLPHASGNSMSIAAPATNPASDLELKLPATIGSAGQVLKNSDTAGTLEFGPPPRLNRNLIINGGFDIWERATDSGSNTDNGYLAADRWYLNSSGATKQVTRQAFDLAQTDVPSYPKYYLRFAVTTANNNAGLSQYIEDVRRVQGQVTLSFWAKGTNPNGGSFGITNRQNFGSGGSSAVDTGYGTFTVSNTWAKKTFTFTPPSISGKTIGSSSYYSVNVFRQPAGDTSTNAYTIDIANVQLEYGNSATDFERLSYGDELARCQRYFYMHLNPNEGSGSTKYNPICTGYYDEADAAFGIVHFPVTMRIYPDLYKVVGTNYFDLRTGSGSDGCDDVAINRTSPTAATILLTGNVSGTVGQGTMMRSRNELGARIGFDAEL